MTNINELMKVERILIEISLKEKFNLSFGEVIELENLLKDIGRMTNMFFLLQEEFYKKEGDKDKLKEYHEKLQNDTVPYNLTDAKRLIEGVIPKIQNEEVKTIIKPLMFWKG